MKKIITYIFWTFFTITWSYSINAQLISRELIESPEDMIVHKIFYRSDSLKVNGYILEPEKGDHFPVIISNRGGAYSYGAFTDSTAIRNHKFLVQAGYMVFATNYRGNMGSEGNEEIGTGDVDDSINLFGVIDSYPRADTSSIGMYGFSRGGMVTFLALTRTDRLKAAVIGGDDGNVYEGYHNIKSIQDQLGGVYEYMWPDEHVRKTKLKNASIYYSLDKMTKHTPIFLFHASRDDVSNTPLLLKTVAELHESGYRYSLKIYDSKEHGISDHETVLDRDIVEWFDRYLKK
jgi:dipeptidyl aminopeptidase/acylaminoacyl peptidase